MQKYKAATSKLVLLDYDGTLVNYTSDPLFALPEKTTLETLRNLSSKPETKLAIVTGRSSESIDHLLQGLSSDIFAEHGAMLKQNHKWQNIMPHNNNNWKPFVLQLLNHYRTLCVGSFVEEKVHSLAWHYRNCNEVQGFSCSRQLINQLESATLQFQLKVTDGNKIVEINSKNISKAIAINYYLSSNPYNFILCIGDDRTDEDMFAALLNNPNAFTIKVGNGASIAKYRLKSVQQVIGLLNEIINV